MDENYSCNLCVKVSLDLHCAEPLPKLESAPSTYNRALQKYDWREYDLMNYAIVPKKMIPDGVHVDVYVCMDEDDLDDVELKQYIGDFMTKAILPSWRGYSLGRISEPTDEPPFEVGCPKAKKGGMQASA